MCSTFMIGYSPLSMRSDATIAYLEVTRMIYEQEFDPYCPRLLP